MIKELLPDVAVTVTMESVSDYELSEEQARSLYHAVNLTVDEWGQENELTITTDCNYKTQEEV